MFLIPKKSVLVFFDLLDPNIFNLITLCILNFFSVYPNWAIARLHKVELFHSCLISLHLWIKMTQIIPNHLTRTQWPMTHFEDFWKISSVPRIALLIKCSKQNGEILSNFMTNQVWIHSIAILLPRFLLSRLSLLCTPIGITNHP